MSRDMRLLAEKLIRAARYDIRTHVIAQIVSYDQDTNLAVCQPVNKAIRLTDPQNTTYVQLPVISDVPVIQYGSGKLWCTVGPQVDTYGLLHICDRIIDDWLQLGGLVEPKGIRCHNLSDAVFEPSLLHLVDDGDNGKLAVPVQTDRISLRTRAGTTEISVLDDETISVNVNGGKATLSIDSDGNVSLNTDGAITATAGDTITLDNGTETASIDGADVKAGTGSDYVAMAKKTQANFDLINTIISGWVVAPMDGGAAFKSAWAAAWPGAVQQVASGNLKAD
jgi:hypothetical protein